MWRRLNERERRLLPALAAICAAAAFYTYLLAPQLEDFRALRKEAAAVERELAAAARLLDELPAEQEALARTESELARMRELFALDARNGSLIVNVGLAAAADGVEVVRFRPLALQETEHVLVLPVEIGLRGLHPAILNHLKSLQGLPHIGEIRQLSFQAEDRTAGGVVRADLLLLVYADPVPATRRSLSELRYQLIGRYDAFCPPETIAPESAAAAPEPGPRLLK